MIVARYGKHNGSIVIVSCMLDYNIRIDSTWRYVLYYMLLTKSRECYFTIHRNWLSTCFIVSRKVLYFTVVRVIEINR